MARVRKAEERVPKRDPLERPDYMEADVQALRALARGGATPEQQRRALDYVIHDVCATYDMPFRPDGDRLTAFACGKQWVGQTLVYLLKNAPTKSSPDEQAARRASEGERPK